ncbi:hypothetical protein JTE90_005962 [Oedothorax gibbosus]|uniref:Uncharacterized protein n=1 Tax=Oedothorax gibbosus TaxID=931172 RepID=A0AAV6UW55_9ARAC|nr:hypothetical protein JTE90_005962 [Oedothorax gibbosus]
MLKKTKEEVVRNLRRRHIVRGGVLTFLHSHLIKIGTSSTLSCCHSGVVANHLAVILSASPTSHKITRQSFGGSHHQEMNDAFHLISKRDNLAL